MEKDSLIFSLKEIADWIKPNSIVEIPALQRGLVWKPRQVELLWDSLLRGFPIGTFMLSDVIGKNRKARYYLMDGQQRFNAISLGFRTVQDFNAVLWVDINPPLVKNSTRRFWIKVTTDAHPWGFHNNDECTILNTAEKRQALTKFGLEGKNIYNDKISLYETWPSCSNRPIPLFCFLNANVDSEIDFYNDVIISFIKSDFKYRSSNLVFTEEERAYIMSELYPVFKCLKDYRIGCSHLPAEVIEKETHEDCMDHTALEILFNRINTGGTRISQDDLNYSAIKAYWPIIKDKNDELAAKYMNPSKLAMLAFRLSLLLQNKDAKWVNELSIKQIRSLSKNDNKTKIEELYNGDKGLDAILKQIDEWLDIDNNRADSTPTVLRTSIAYDSPDVFLLLMYFAKHFFDYKSIIGSKEIKALAFILHWFGNDKRKAVMDIYNNCFKTITIEGILQGISKSMHDKSILNIYSYDEVSTWYSGQCDPNWNFSKLEYGPWIHFFNRTFWYGSVVAKEMLLYAQRKYINSQFGKYDPARRNLWADYNRPWDYDHITPQDWINKKRGPFRVFDQIWLSSIGNIAAISFEMNRRKGNKEDYEEYRKFSRELLYSESSESISPDITWKEMDSGLFAHITYDRFLKIYEQAYNVINVLAEKVVLSDILQERKNLFQNVIDKYGAKAYFALEEGKEYEVVRAQDWTRDWIGVGFVIGDYYACLEWEATKEDNNTRKNVELGIRKAPQTQVTQTRRNAISKLSLDGYVKETDNGWWYYWKDASKLIDEELISELRLLSQKIVL